MCGHVPRESLFKGFNAVSLPTNLVCICVLTISVPVGQRFTLMPQTVLCPAVRHLALQGMCLFIDVLTVLVFAAKPRLSLRQPGHMTHLPRSTASKSSFYPNQRQLYSSDLPSSRVPSRQPNRKSPG